MKSKALLEKKRLWRFVLGIIIVICLPTIMALSCSDKEEPVTMARLDVIDQVRTGSRVDLDARGSWTDKNKLLYYSWLPSFPPGSQAVLANLDKPLNSFVADVDGEYRIVLRTNLDIDPEPSSHTRTIKASSLNAAPVAQSGANQEVMVGSTVQLDAGGSFDADDDELYYSWTFTSGANVPLSGHDTVTPTFVANDSVSPYRLKVFANDGQVDSSPKYITITPNRAGSSFPVAMAGLDQYVSSDSLVELDGSGSYSPEPGFSTNALLDYKWQMLHKPSSSEAVLSINSAVKPSFTADVDGAYIFRLFVYDEGRENRNAGFDGINNHVVVVFAGNGNIPPQADGGVDRIIDQSIEVTLNASNSSDAEGAPLSYDWSIFKAPLGSSQALSATNQVSTSFTPDLNGIYLIRLVVNDGQDDSAPDIVRVIANIGTNLPPLADAGADQPSAITGNLVTLDGSGSSDPENIPPSYLWSIQQQPMGGNATLSDDSAMSPSFTPNVDGEYIVRLVVNDDSQESLPDEVSVIASSANPFTELNVNTNLPFVPDIPEVDTLIMIDLNTSNTIDLVSSINAPNGANDEHVALIATFDFVSMIAADFFTNTFWNLISQTHTNSVSDSVTPSFIVQRISDSQYYKITLDFTVDVSAVIQIDAIQVWNCGNSESNCPL